MKICFALVDFKLVYQIVGSSGVRPDSGSWKVYDFTTTAITSVAGETIDPKLLENQTPSVNGFILNKLNEGIGSYICCTSCYLLNRMNIFLKKQLN